MNSITFANIDFLYLLLIPILIIIWHLKFKKLKPAYISFPNLSIVKKQNTFKTKFKNLPLFLKILSCILLIFAIAKPQSSINWEESSTKGIDIILAIDISGSMLAEDLKPNRLEAAKSVASDFILKRKNDRIGLVIFSGESFTQCPLTTDHSVLINLFKGIKSGMISDGTAIGMGLANSINRLKNSKAKSKVIILLTDGVNNKGYIAPLTAAEMASEYDVRVYTVGVGSEGFAPYPFQTPFGMQYQDIEVKIDEETLQDIASLTMGKYFRAKDNNSLKLIYEEINKLEKSKIDVVKFNKKKEEYRKFANCSFILLVLSFILESTYLKRIP